MLELQRFLVKQKVSLFQGRADYDIFDPDSQQQVGTAQELRGFLGTLLAMLVSKRSRPRTIEVRDHDGALLFSIYRPWSFIRSKVRILDENGQLLGYLTSKVLSLGGGFWVYDPQDKQIAELKGDWKGWSFKFLSPDGRELGQIGKKWAGLAKEMFTTADTYMVSIDDSMAGEQIIKTLLLAGSLAVDIVYKEGD